MQTACFEPSSSQLKIDYIRKPVENWEQDCGKNARLLIPTTIPARRVGLVTKEKRIQERLVGTVPEHPKV